MCVMLESLVRICSETQPEEKEENTLDAHICSIFDQYLLFTNCSSQKKKMTFYSCDNCLAGVSKIFYMLFCSFDPSCPFEW